MIINHENRFFFYLIGIGIFLVVINLCIGYIPRKYKEIRNEYLAKQANLKHYHTSFEKYLKNGNVSEAKYFINSIFQTNNDVSERDSMLAFLDSAIVKIDSEHIAMIDSFIVQSNYSKALEIIPFVIDRHPEYLEKKNNLRAKLDSITIEKNLNLAGIYITMKKYDEAIVILNKVVKSRPDYQEVLDFIEQQKKRQLK